MVIKTLLDIIEQFARRFTPAAWLFYNSESDNNFLKNANDKSSKLQCKSTKYKSIKSTIVQKYKKCKDVKNVKSTKNTKVKNKIKTPAISIKKHYK